MTIVEFNEMELIERHQYLFSQEANVEFKSLRDDESFKYSLWYCNDFYVEMKVKRNQRGAVSIEAFGSQDERINLYIEFYKENRDKEYPLG